MAGVSRLQYAHDIRLIRVMCSGRVDLEFIFRAFANGEDGVLVGGCKLGECNYVTHGNFDALSNVFLSKKLLTKMGINPERLAIEFMSGGDGNILADVINQFSAKTRQLGPIGEAEGISAPELKLYFESVRKLIPFLKMVERERLRVPVKTEKAYREFWRSDETNQLFDELVGAPLAISRILLLLGEKPMSTGEISEALRLDPSAVSMHMNVSSRRGWVQYDSDRKCYVLAGEM